MEKRPNELRTEFRRTLGADAKRRKFVRYSSLDLICSSVVFAALGVVATQEGVRYGIRLGRMRVRPAWRTWVTEFIGCSPASLLVQPESHIL